MSAGEAQADVSMDSPAESRGSAGRLRALTAVAAAVVMSGVVAILQLVPATAQSPTVSIVDFGFSPATVQAQMGPAEPGFPQPHAHVGFFNNGAVQHNVTFDDGRVTSSPSLNPNQFFDAVLTVAGSFSFHCSIHPSMQGTISVTPLPTTTTSSTTTTTAPPTTLSPTTVPPATVSPTSAAATTTTGRPRTTVATANTRPPAGVVTSTTAVAPVAAASEATTVPIAEPPSTTTSVAPEVGNEVAVAAPSNPSSDAPPWPLVVLVLVMLSGGGLLVGRAIWMRRRVER